MSIEEFIKQIKKLKDIKINCEIKDNIFFGYIQGIINSMEKKKRITNKDLLNIMNARFDNLEKDIKILKREATKHGWDLSSDK